MIEFFPRCPRLLITSGQIHGEPKNFCRMQTAGFSKSHRPAQNSCSGQVLSRALRGLSQRPRNRGSRWRTAFNARARAADSVKEI